MSICCYGTKDHFKIAPSLPKFELAENIRSTAISYDTIIILDDAIDSITSSTTLFNFYRKLKNTKIIFIYENPELQVYESIFDNSYLMQLDKLSVTIIANIIANEISDEILSLSRPEAKDEDLEFELPKSLPEDPNKLIDIINDMSDKLSVLKSRNRHITKEHSLLDGKYKNAIYNINSLRNKIQKERDLMSTICEQNMQLTKFKDVAVSLMSKPENIAKTINLDLINHQNITLIHIKEIDELLFTRTFLYILKKKIEMMLGLPTKIVVLEDLNKRISYYENYYQVYNSYSSNLLYSNEFIIKKGFSDSFIADLLADRSNPRVIIIYNTIHSLTFEEKHLMNYFAAKGSPKRYGMTSDFPNHTITNYPGFPLSFEYHNEYERYKKAQLAPYHLIEKDVFNNILSDLKDILNIKKTSSIRRELDEITKIE